MRLDNRPHNQMREIKIIPNVNRYAEGSAEIHYGHTKVLVTASVQNSLPKWLKQHGWISAEYNMLPRSTHSRINRKKAAEGGRAQELSRLIGRSLRSAVDLVGLGERQILIDCDVLQADGGTRTAAITGGFVAMSLALRYLQEQKFIKGIPLHYGVAALSVGIDKSQNLLVDLDYEEDSQITADTNFVFTHRGDLIEVQGTAEGQAFSQEQFKNITDLAHSSLPQVLTAQKEALPFLDIWEK